MNRVLCIGRIVQFGCVCYRRSREYLPRFIGATFGLFGILHAATLFGFTVSLTVPLIVIQTQA
ncbi:MAG: hypothetical protein WCF90_10660 [Methanomicrobiales archaeon]